MTVGVAGGLFACKKLQFSFDKHGGSFRRSIIVIFSFLPGLWQGSASLLDYILWGSPDPWPFYHFISLIKPGSCIYDADGSVGVKNWVSMTNATGKGRKKFKTNGRTLLLRRANAVSGKHIARGPLSRGGFLKRNCNKYFRWVRAIC